MNQHEDHTRDHRSSPDKDESSAERSGTNNDAKVERSGATADGEIWRESASAVAIGAGVTLYRSPSANEIEGGESTALLVEDDVKRPGDAQMRKSAFLIELERAICVAAEKAFEGVRWSPEGCPWVAHWFAYYRGRSAAHVEKALRRYAPEVTDAASARDYIPAVTARVRAAIITWKMTGKVAGVPDEKWIEASRAPDIDEEMKGENGRIGFAADLGRVRPDGGRRSYAAGADGAIVARGAAGRNSLRAGRALRDRLRDRLRSGLHLRACDQRDAARVA